MLHSFCSSSASLRQFAKSAATKAPIIGIDLGTTNSCVSVVQGGQTTVIPNSIGRNTTPSVVSFDKEGKVIVGQHALNQAVLNPRSTFYATKRLIGRRFEDPTVKKCQTMVPYGICRAANGDAWVQDEKGKQYAPSQIGAYVLSDLKKSAEKYLNQTITEAVITVPAYFNDSQRASTKDAGRIAGLNVRRIINEPTAAALSYGIKRQEGQTIAVFDLGGGTFDISILEIGKEGVFMVKSTNGDTFLGGEDFDSAIMKHVLTQFQKESGLDLSKDQMALSRVKEACEKAKCDLSSMNSTEIYLPYIGVTPSGPKHLQMKLLRNELERLTRPLIERCVSPIDICLKDAGLTPKNISEVVMVGGMTRMPAVIDRVRKYFGKEPFCGVHPDEVVATGAALQGSIIAGVNASPIVLIDVTPLSLGIETMGGVFAKLIPRNTTLPTRKTQTFSTAVDGQTHVNIKVYQGEREMVSGNKLLGEFTLEGIPPAPKGIPKIDVTFDIDVNSIVHVSAKDKTSNKEQNITIKDNGGLTQEEIEKFIKDAEKNAEADRKERALVEKKSQYQQYIDDINKLLVENEKNLPADLVKKIRDAEAPLQTALNGKDEVVLDQNYETYKKATMDLYDAINQANQAKADAEKKKQ